MRQNLKTAYARFLKGTPSPRSERGSIWTDGSSIYSYATCLLARGYGGTFHLNTTPYSRTTTTQQRSLEVIMRQEDRPVRYIKDQPRGVSAEKLSRVTPAGLPY